MAAATSNTTFPKSDITDEAFVHVSAERVSSEKQNDEELDAKNELINDELTDLVAEKSALRKFDWILLPQIMMIAIMAALDRINIGNARVMGFEGMLYMHTYYARSAVG